ncbi:hypothetical protein WL505_12450, partial [Staphylococcus warneri]
DKQAELNKAKKALDKQKDSVNENKTMLQQTGKLKDAQQDIAKSETQLKNKGNDIKKLDDINYEIQPRSDYNQGYSQFGESAKR